MLFWAEGSRSRNSVYFTNSDPAMVRFFLDFLVDEVGVGRHAVRIDINLFADHRAEQRRIEQHWLDTLELPAVCLRASTVNVYSRHSARKRLNRLPYGTCRLSVHSTRIVQHLYGAIQAYGGFERPQWLDCERGRRAHDPDMGELLRLDNAEATSTNSDDSVVPGCERSAKISVSIPRADFEFLDAYGAAYGLDSRSSVIRRAIQLLRAAESGSDSAETRRSRRARAAGQRPPAEKCW